MGLTTIVAIPTVPERWGNVLPLLSDLARQTQPPTEIALFLNGYNFIPDELQETAVSAVLRDAVRQGPGTRWRYLSARATGYNAPDIALTLDDDFRLDPDYIERTVGALTTSPATMIAWTGHPTPRRYIGIEDSRVWRPLWAGGTGAGAIWLRAIIDIDQHPLADECFGAAGDEEALVSLWLWQHHKYILRPSGPAPLRHVPELQYASTASHRVHGPRWAARRREIMTEYGWTT